MVSVTSLFIIAVSCVQMTYSIVSLKDISQLRRVFGNPRFSGRDTDIHIMHVPKECRNKTYCTIMPKYYPQERFNNMFKNKTVFPQPTLRAVDANLDNRYGEIEYNACEIEIEKNPLSMVKDNRNVWRIVIQAPEYSYSQQVYIVKCKKEYGKCLQYDFFPSDIVLYCKQIYTTVSLLVTKGEIDTEIIHVKLPACCLCSCKRRRLDNDPPPIENIILMFYVFYAILPLSR